MTDQPPLHSSSEKADSSLTQQGTVTGYDPALGYGWIRPDSGDRPLRVLSKALVLSDITSLQAGQRVRYQVDSDHMGELIVSQLAIMIDHEQSK